MKYNIDNLNLCTDNELYDALLPLTEKIYDQYSYVKIEQSCYNKIVMDSMKESRKILDNSKIDTFDKLFLDCLQNNINEYIKTLLPNQTEAIILGFIETNIKPSNKYTEVIKEFQKLVNFMQDIDFISSLDFSNILLLFEKYKCIEDMVEQIVDTNIDNIKKSGIDNIFKDYALISFVEAYCLKHNIEVYDDKLVFNEFLQANDSSFYDYNDKYREYDYNDDSYNENNDDDYDSYVIYLKEIGKHPLLSKDEEQELFAKFAQGDKKARKKLIDSNLRLVVFIAKRFRESGLPFLDLIQEGNLGLIEAVDHYDITKGFKFSTYASRCIKQKIRRALFEKSNFIRIPEYKCTQLYQYQNVKANLSNPSIQEIAEKMDISVAKVTELEQIKTDVISMNFLIKENGDTELGDLISDTEVNVEDTVIKAIEPAEIRRLVTNSNLDLKEIKVLTLRYGLDGEDPKSLEETGEIFNCTLERIRQIEFKALRKLRGFIKKSMDYSKSCNQESNEQKTTKASKIFELNKRKGNILKIVHDYFDNRYIKYTKRQVDGAFSIVLDRDSMRYFFKDYLYSFEKSSDLDEKTNKIIEERLIPEISRYLSKNTRLELKTDATGNQYIRKM